MGPCRYWYPSSLWIQSDSPEAKDIHPTARGDTIVAAGRTYEKLLLLTRITYIASQ